MSQHLIDTDIEVAQCPRCKSIGFKAHYAGLAVAADATPLNDMVEVREALIAGRQVHRVIMRGGRPWRLKTITTGDHFTGVLVADHACGIRPISAHVVEPIPVDPQQAPVMPGRPVDGFPHQEQTVSAAQGHTRARATTATRRRSSWGFWRCDACRKVIEEDEEMLGLEVPGQPRWARHIDCKSPKMPASDILTRERDYTSYSQLARQGLADKGMETLELPEVDDGA